MIRVIRSYRFIEEVADISFKTSTVMPKRHRYYWEARPENKQRKLLMQITLPRLKPSLPYERKNTEAETENDKLYGLDLVFQQEVLELLEKSKMIAVYMKAQMEESDFYRMRHALRKENIFLEEYPNHVMELTLKETRFASLSSLYHSDTLTIYSEDLKVKEMLQVMKKVPYVVLMGGFVENRLLSANQMLEYSKMPSLHQHQSELSFLLSSGISSTWNILQRNQSMLSLYLSQYVEDKSRAKSS